jgi:putative DNA primase/helicase
MIGKTEGEQLRTAPQGTSSNNFNDTKDSPKGQSQTPAPLPVIASNIPEELKELTQWVCWKYEWNGKKWTKPPYQPNGYKANKMNPDDYSDFSDVIAAYNKGGFSGVGFVLTANDPFVAIDIDHCLEGNVLTDEASDIIKALNSYTEISPSGTGIRIFVKGTVPRNIKKGIEIYINSSYVTITGQRWQS